MKGNKKISEYGKATQFGKGNDPVEARKKSSGNRSIMTMLKERFELDLGFKFSQSSITELLENLISMDVATLKKLQNNDNIPVPLSNYISGLLKDKEAGRTVTIDNLLDRLYGKAMETIKTENKTEFIIPEESVLNNDKKMLEIAEHIRNTDKDKE